MKTHADKAQKNTMPAGRQESQSMVNSVVQKQSRSESVFQFVDNRPESATKRKLQEMANNSSQAKQAAQLQAIINNHSSQQQQPIQKKENKTGLPDNLKTGIENLSGYSMDDVKVHYNSDKPAQLQAHAYAQGSDIHLASGQEKHLPHEAWHVVQQKQGRVKPTMQMKSGVNVNDDVGLEKEADVMGSRAFQLNANASSSSLMKASNINGITQLLSSEEKEQLKAKSLNGRTPTDEEITVLNAFNDLNLLDEFIAKGIANSYETLVGIAQIGKPLGELLELMQIEIGGQKPAPQEVKSTGRFTYLNLFSLSTLSQIQSWADMALLGTLTKSSPEIVSMAKKKLSDIKPTLNELISLDKYPDRYLDELIKHGGIQNWTELINKAGKKVESMEVESNSDQFHDEQLALTGEIMTCLQTAGINGGVFRIASLQLTKLDDNIVVNITTKDLEEGVGGITKALLNEVPGGGDLMPRVKSNVLQTLINAGQFQWILNNWDNIAATHDIYVDVDFYPDRMADRGGLLHKDSIGETLFVNLTYNNAGQGASAEYMYDNVVREDVEADYPDSAKVLLSDKRWENVFDDQSIKGVDLPAHGRTSFIDPAIWHATPYYDHRVPELQGDESVKMKISEFIEIVSKTPHLDDRQKQDTLELLNRAPDKNVEVTIKQIKDALRRSEPFRKAVYKRGNTPVEVDVAPTGRRQRARSVDLTNRPEKLPVLKQQGTQARSFIRTWVILKKR